jgi:hypothetical protein
VLLSGAMVGVAVSGMAKNPSFVHRKPVFKFDWIWVLEIDAHPEMGKGRRTESIGV